MSKKQAPPQSNSSTQPVADSLQRERISPKEKPALVEGRQQQREEALENLFTFLHLSQEEKSKKP